MGWLVALHDPGEGQELPAAARSRDRGSLAIAAWFDRWSTTALTVELTVMIFGGGLAMAADRWLTRGDRGLRLSRTPGSGTVPGKG